MTVYWRGIFKLIEECGELLCELGKAAVVPVGTHWDEKYGKLPLRVRIAEECADVLAAVQYFIETNYSEEERKTIEERCRYKRERFESWVLSGVKP